MLSISPSTQEEKVWMQKIDLECISLANAPPGIHDVHGLCNFNHQHRAGAIHPEIF